MRPALRSSLLLLAASSVAACNLVFGIQSGDPAGTGPASCGAGGAKSPSPLALLRGISLPAPDHAFARANAVALGPGGDLVVGGAFASTISLGGGVTLPYVDDPGAPFQRNDAFLAAFTPKGGILWARAFGGLDDQNAFDVAVDAASGDVAVTGQLRAAADFGTGKLSSAGGDDIFVARFTQSGTPVWAKRFGDGTDQVGVKVAFDPQGNLILAATGGGIVDFGSGTPRGDGSGDGVFIVKLDAKGDELWSRYYPSGGSPANRVGVAVDPAGDIFVTGANRGADMSVLGQPADAFRGGADVFVIAFDPGGTTLWSHLFGGTGPESQNGDQWGNSVAVGPCGDVFVTGGFQTSLQIGQLPPLTNKEAPAPDHETADLFVARFTHDGTPVWARSWGDGGEQQGGNVSLDGQSNVLVTGWIVDDLASQGIDFGDGTLWPPSGLSGETDYRGDAFILRLSADGKTTRFSRRMGGPEDQRAFGSTTGAAGDITVVGMFEQSLAYDGSPAGTITENWGVNMFVLAAGP